MGGSKQPYMYERVDYAPFDPKAHSNSLAKPAPQRIQPQGPLVDFNRHPDSYDNLPYGRHSDPIEPLSPFLKGRILKARKLQLISRLIQLLTAIVVLICVITIKGAPNTQGWILRLPVCSPSLPNAVRYCRGSETGRGDEEEEGRCCARVIC